MRIVFFGTPEYVLPVLTSLDKTFKNRSGISPIVAVVSQGPKPTGRKKVLSYSAVDRWAHKRKIPVYYRADDLVKEGVSADLGVLAAYGEIIPEKIIRYFPHGILNIHPSLLPKYRGASPVRAAIVSGDKQTGVTIIKLDEEVDHGPIISQFPEDIKPEDTTDTLRERLFEMAAPILTELIPSYLKGKITPRVQEDKKAIFTTQTKKAHAFIPPKYLTAALSGHAAHEKWKIPFVKDSTQEPTPQVLERFIRAMQTWPIAWTQVKTPKEKRLKISKAHLENNNLILDRVQLEGKKEVAWKQFKEGYPKVIFE